ncbi:MAG: molybdopterin molybdenumtransferase MoeA [Calditrichaeota bacterium]|nr:MAG: molybdopterin molybdenumtransferase MoeA [Calditrichota bacterium]
MITVAEAHKIIAQHTQVLGQERRKLDLCGGYILAEDVYSDIDMPPFDRSMMDGYAVRSEDLQIPPVELNVVGFIPAGSYPDFKLNSGEAAKIMTGAALPEGADSVREVELTKPGHGANSVIIQKRTQPGLHVVKKATEIGNGQRILTSGMQINPAVAGVLATVGKSTAKVIRKPRVAILSTGDELVHPSENPKKGQIRNSNTYTLKALCDSFGLECELLGIVRDEQEIIRHKISLGLQADLLLISGGVSMGDLDFVSDVFKYLALQILFEKVKIKPGKPTVFATHDNGIVFGLPGNPVSSSTVFEVLVRPAILQMMGKTDSQNHIVNAEITEPFYNRSNRENYHPCMTYYNDGKFFTRPLRTKGSGDIAGYAKHNSLLICPPNIVEMSAGSACIVQLCDNYFS